MYIYIHMTYQSEYRFCCDSKDFPPRSLPLSLSLSLYHSSEFVSVALTLFRRWSLRSYF